MWQETPLRCGEGSQLILFGPAGDSGASLTLVSHGSRGRCLVCRHVCQASARPLFVHSMCNSYLLFHTPPVLKRHSGIPAPAKPHQTEMLKSLCTCFPDHFKCELMRFWHYSGEHGARCNGSHITFLTRKKKYLNICVSVWGLMFFSWWPCFIQLGASPLWSIAELSQAVRVKGKERYLILSPSLSLSQTRRAQEIRSDFHVILYIFADEEEKSSTRTTKLNFLVTVSFVTSSTVEMFYSI